MHSSQMKITENRRYMYHFRKNRKVIVLLENYITNISSIIYCENTNYKKYSSIYHKFNVTVYLEFPLELRKLVM